MSETTESTWLIVGLGNPGAQYENTRHNLGFMVIDHLARRGQTQVKRDECRALIGRAEVAQYHTELAKPQTFMNLSGESIACLIKKPSRGLDRLIVISDDLALPFGKIRLRAKGSHGGHNGLRSIIDRTGSNEFIRLRIGILPDHPLNNTRDFVLQKFSRSESAEIENILETGVNAVEAVIKNGIEKAMAEYNRDAD